MALKDTLGSILNSRIVTTAIIVVVIILFAKWGYGQYQSMKTELNISLQNQSALQDSIRVQKNKVGQLEYAKELLVVQNKKELANLNDRLATLSKNFNGKINELTDLVGEIKGDTIIIDGNDLVDLPNGVTGIEWAYSKTYDSVNSRSLEGITKFKFDSITDLIEPLETVITKDDIRFNITQGIRTRDDGKVEMFASSDYPNFEAKELNSVIIDPESHPALKKFSRKKKFGFGLYGGVGGTLNLSNSTVVFGPQVGGGVTFKF